MSSEQRFLWALSVLGVGKDDTILEIGCGTGIMAGMIASQLEHGKVVAIDRSAAMIRQARKRNGVHEKEGRCIFLQEEYADLFTAQSFDAILAFNVNDFWKQPQKMLEQTKRLLKPGCCLFLFYQFPYKVDEKKLQRLQSTLQHPAFSTSRWILPPVKDPFAFCLAMKHHEK